MWKSEKPIFDYYDGRERASLGQAGIFADCESIGKIEKYPWPDAANCNFTETAAVAGRVAQTGQAVVSGLWCSFFHDLCNFFGMENYYMKMYTDPGVIIAVTEHVVDFYLEASEKLYALAADKIDAVFFGNDFGSQLDLMVSPDCFDKFIMPYLNRLIGQAHRYGLKVMLHSCGSVDRIIPMIIDAGVVALHPIQALAANMDAGSLSKKYNGKIVFIGGVDTQRLLIHGTPQQIREEVKRLKSLFGPNFIVSPSHESLLPNVSPENIEAMADEALV